MTDTEGRRYASLDDKVENIERYLIQQVDTIRRYVVIAIVVAALGAAAAILSVWLSTRSPGGSPLAGPPSTEGAIRHADAAEAARAAPVAAPGVVSAETRPAGGAVIARAGPAPEAMKREAALADAARKELAARRSASATPQPPAPARKPPEVSPTAAAIDSIDPPGTVAARTAEDAVTTTAKPAVSATDSYFRVGESTIAAKMAGLNPVGGGRRFPAKKGTVYCWSRILTDSLKDVPRARRVIIHRWIRNGEVVRERSFGITSPRYRVYSALSRPEAGDWRVDIVEAGGGVIGTEKFVVR